MRKPSHVAGLMVAIAATLVVTGCVQSGPRVIPTAPETVKPVFASDAEALAAAEKAYKAYLAVSDAVGSNGGKDTGPLERVVTPKWLPTELRSYASLEKSGETMRGTSRFTSFTVQQFSQSSAGLVTLTAYVCDDLSNVRVISATGADVTPTTRQAVIPLQVHFRNSIPFESALLVEGSDPWAGSDFCS
jgi:hypothetical protein